MLPYRHHDELKMTDANTQQNVATEDRQYMRDLHAAMLDQPIPKITWALYLIAAVLVAASIWASMARRKNCSIRSSG